jgi:hypothetical protein
MVWPIKKEKKRQSLCLSFKVKQVKCRFNLVSFLGHFLNVNVLSNH